MLICSDIELTATHLRSLIKMACILIKINNTDEMALIHNNFIKIVYLIFFDNIV